MRKCRLREVKVVSYSMIKIKSVLLLLPHSSWGISQFPRKLHKFELKL